MRKRIVVLGSSFAGYTAALALKQKLGADHDVVVVSRSDEFLFSPALVWVPFGLRDRSSIALPVRRAFDKAGVVFKHVPAHEIDLTERRVMTATGVEAYDYLILATGPRPDYAAIAGLDPDLGHAQSIATWHDACRARVAFEQFVREPGPVVVGVAQGSSGFGSAYELLFHLSHQLRRRGLSSRAPLTFVTAEPFVGHFGNGGLGGSRKAIEKLLEAKRIEAITGVRIASVEAGSVRLEDGRSLPFAFAAIAPPIAGVDAVRACTDLVDERGFVVVDDCYRTAAYPEVFAAGGAVAVGAVDADAQVGGPRSGYLSEETAKIVAHNVVASIRGEQLVALSPRAIDARYAIDASGAGADAELDPLATPRPHQWLVPGAEGHWAHAAFEKYFIATGAKGLV